MTKNSLDLGSSRVLVVDDVAFYQLLIGQFLIDLGVGVVDAAADGVEGLARARQYRPDLIILDINMPRMDGHEMLAHLKADPALSTIPVIVQTTEDSGDSRQSTFAAGATDFVSKPLNAAEFKARSRVHLENSLLVRRLEEKVEQMAGELQEAAGLQRAMLPTARTLDDVADRMGLSIAHRFEPCSALGGDFWGILPLDGRCLAVYSCDFAGHGVSAALDTIRLHTLLLQMPPPPPEDPASFVAALNRSLCTCMAQRRFATFFFAVFDLVRDSLIYVGAGAPNPVIGCGVDTELLNAAGLPLGITEHAVYENRSVAFPAGSYLFLHSDAIAESGTHDGRLLGAEGVRLLASAAARSGGSSAARLNALLRSFSARIAMPAEDDLTAVWVQRRS